MTDRVCATPGCDNPVAARHGTTGRPPIYCSRACRLALRVARRRPQPEHITAEPAEITIGSDDDGIAVEMGQDPDDPTPMRSWTVTIHRGQQAVTVGHSLGRFAATALTGDLRQLFNPNTQQDGGRPID
jgi:hypothetical protein